MLEPPRTSACTPCFPCKAVVGEGSVQSNHLGKTSPCFALCEAVV